VEAVRLFLAHGVDIETRDKVGRGYLSSTEYLRVKQCGATALDWAIRPPTDLLEYLISLGADINTADNVPIDHGDFH
jgi:hypothetical protein